uniref:Uncharacterized protein MANES_17G065200 n=1 Tax=Rhizophora mucronata TaxID=61149 RepID=A0A2P2L186_RHIMU
MLSCTCQKTEPFLGLANDLKLSNRNQQSTSNQSCINRHRRIIVHRKKKEE